MQLRNKYYTHPVLMEGTDFYENSLFETNVDAERVGYDICFKMSATLQNKLLVDYLRSGDVVIVYHIECPQTCYRKAISTNELELSYTLRDKDINGKVEICSFLIANKNIPSYCNDDFSADYRGFRFDIEQGCIMGVGNQVNFIVNKIKDDLSSTSSIFSIIPNYDENISVMQVDLMGEKIVISLPVKAFNVYKNMSSMLDIQSTMHSIVIIPALQYVFNELKSVKDQLYEYEDKRWFINLSKACAKMNVALNEDNMENINPLEMAQLLIDAPITDGLINIAISEDIDEN